jgi:hypothetical protein
MSAQDLGAACKAVAANLAAVVDVTHEAEFPPWTDPRFDEAMAELRHTIDVSLDGKEEQVLHLIAAQHGLDFCAMEGLAGDLEHVEHWLTILLGSNAPARDATRVLAVIVGVYLCPDELAYLGVLAIAAADEFEGVLADGG